MAIFIYRNVYCRYLCAAECIIQDRGEFCNKVTKLLAERFNCPIRVISAGRPQANGQAEAYVKNIKMKMKAVMAQKGYDELPDNWDETILPLALQAVRCDPAISTGYAPAELLLGRRLVYPIEMSEAEIDISGTTMTKPLVDALRSIHNDAFGKAAKKVRIAQERMARSYDKKYKTNELKLRKNMPIQILDFSAKKSKDYRKGRMKFQWKPFRSYYKVHAVNRKKGLVSVRSRGGRVYKKTYPISRVRLYKGKIKN